MIPLTANMSSASLSSVVSSVMWHTVEGGLLGVAAISLFVVVLVVGLSHFFLWLAVWVVGFVVGDVVDVRGTCSSNTSFCFLSSFG